LCRLQTQNRNIPPFVGWAPHNPDFLFAMKSVEELRRNGRSQARPLASLAIQTGFVIRAGYEWAVARRGLVVAILEVSRPGRRSR
jgi:hypothetical protein